MNKAIKFRGKRVDNGEWIYGSLVVADNGTFIIELGIGIIDFSPEYNANAVGCGVEDRGLEDRYEGAEYGFDEGVRRTLENVPEFIEVIPDTVGQYIGHKDEVNTEIYYGDVIDNDDYIFLVRNALYGCYLEQLSHPEDEDDEDWSAYLSTHLTDNSKIIGNVWDNPELLTQ